MAVVKVHGFDRQKDCELHAQAPLRAGRTQLQLAAPSDHVLQHLVERELILARPGGDEFADFRTVAAEEVRGELLPVVPRIVGKESLEIAVVEVGIADQVSLPLVGVVLAQGHAKGGKGLGSATAVVPRGLPGQSLEQLLDVLELSQGGPAGVAPAPAAAAGAEDHSESLGKVLHGMALRIVEAEVVHVAPACRIGAVEIGISAGRVSAKELPLRVAAQGGGV